MSSPREREKRDRRESRGDEREGQGRKNESEETEEIKTSPLYPYPLQGSQALPNCKPISVGRPGDVRYTAPSHHPTTPIYGSNVDLPLLYGTHMGSIWELRGTTVPLFKQNIKK